MPYKDHYPQLAPPPLNGPNGKKYFQGIGTWLDNERSRLLQGVLARFPGKILRDPTRLDSNPSDPNEYAPADALDQIGEDRLIPRGGAASGTPETDTAYAARLLDAWKIWGGDDTPVTGKGGPAGSHLGILNALKAAGFPTGSTGATIVQYNGTYSQLDGSGNLVFGDLMQCIHRADLTGALTSPRGWMFDALDSQIRTGETSGPAHWASFGVVFPADVSGLDNTYGNAKKSVLNETVRRWRPAKAWYRGAWVVVGSAKPLGWPVPSRTLVTEPALGTGTVRFIDPN